MLIKEHSQTTSGKANKFEAREVAALVPMPMLLQELGFNMLNTRTRRARCLLHKGTNPTSFSWSDDGLVHCFGCGWSGDKISLVQEVRRCGFKDALRFLASMAGVDLVDDPALRTELRRRKQQRDRLKATAAKLVALESNVMFSYRDRAHYLDHLRRNASERLATINAGAAERFLGEAEAAWELLRLTASELRVLVAGYYLVVFASEADRAHFALYPEDRPQMIADVLSFGGVLDDRGRFVEVCL